MCHRNVFITRCLIREEVVCIPFCSRPLRLRIFVSRPPLVHCMVSCQLQTADSTPPQLQNENKTFFRKRTLIHRHKINDKKSLLIADDLSLNTNWKSCFEVTDIIWPLHNDAKKPWKWLKPWQMGSHLRVPPQELSNEYQHERVQLVSKNLCALLL